VKDDDRRDEIARELDAELRFHFDQTVAELRRHGLDLDAARREARRRFGDQDDWRRRILRGDLRRPWSLRRAGEAVTRGFVGCARDLTSGARALAGVPLLSLSASAVFAIVGAAATIAVAMAGGVLVRPMPYPEPERLTYVWGRNPNVRAGFTNLPISEPDLADWRQRARDISAIGGAVPASLSLTGGGEPERVPAAAATGDLFAALGIEPIVGRVLTADDGLPGARPVVVIGHDLWRRRFGGDRSAVGRLVTLNDRPTEIVGVMPSGFSFPRVEEIASHYGFEQGIAAWVPWRSGDAGPVVLGNRYVIVAARLAPHSTRQAAERELNAIAAALRRGDTGGQSFVLISFRDQAVAGVRGSLWLLAASVVVLAGIAALNLAHLLLVRVGDRHRQFAIRAALGATRLALVRQIVAEAVLLALIGGAAGLAAGAAALRGVRALAPADFPRLDATVVDGTVMLTASAAVLLAALVVGAGAAVGLRRVSLEGELRTTSRGNTARRQSGRWLVGVEVAMSVLLLVAGGLLARSFWRVATADPGFDATGVLTFRLTMPPGRYPTGADVRRGYDAVLAELGSQTGIVRAALTWQLPMTGVEASASYRRDDGTHAMALIHRVSPGYFTAMGMRVVRGCGLDCESDLPAVVLNESAVRAHWNGRDPIGHTIAVNGERSRITGIVSDVRHGSLEQAPAAELYQRARLRTMFVVVRSDRAVEEVAAISRAAVATVDPGLAVSDMRTLDDRLSATTARRRFTMTGIGIFAALSTLLALVGVYGVTALLAARRRPEIAIRLALGATPRSATWLLLRQNAAIVAAGLVGGLAGALVVSRQLAPHLYQTSPTDPPVYVAVIVLLAAAAGVATVVPARRAGRVSPREALQGE
jgi:predicted permease